MLRKVPRGNGDRITFIEDGDYYGKLQLYNYNYIITITFTFAITELQIQLHLVNSRFVQLHIQFTMGIELGYTNLEYIKHNPIIEKPITI